MNTPLRVLVIEDSEADAELLIQELRKGGYDPIYKSVDKREAVQEALEKEEWDVVISDYNMPAFDGLEALRTLQERGLDLPFILISGKIDEETAVAAMKAGAHDYITKDKMGRLIPSIQRELREVEVRRKSKRAEEELKEYHNSLERMVEECTAQWKTSNEQLLTEIGERKQAEEHLKKSKEFSDALNRINETIHSTLDFDDIIRRAVNEAGAILNVTAITIGLFRDDSFVIKYGYNVPEEFIGAHVGPEHLEGAQYAASVKGVIVFNDAYNDERVNQEDMKKFSIRALLTAPLISRGFVFGAINIYSLTPFFFTDDHVDFIRKLSISLALALDNAHLFNDRKLIEEEMRHMAHHDALTGLPNRRLFADLIKLECAEARRHQTRIALLFMDLDRFKEINDTLGHDIGDKLLKEVAVRLKSTVRESDTVCRTGGDEFNILLADFSKVEDVTDIAQKIVGSFRRPFSIAGHELHMTTSIGISICPDDSDDIDALFRFADIAMYYAKEQGRNTFQFYNPEINSRSIEKMKLEGMLRKTIDRGELVVYYQPQVNIRTRQMMCAEALVRWNHPEKGALEAKQFIPAAENTGFITAIDEWVLRTACAQVRAWMDDGLPSVCIGVNLSAREFQNPELTKRIAQILFDTGAPPECLDIEITESLAMSNIERTISRLKEMSELGVHTSIDDFGTGYSSLNYLKRLPIETLKIDKSFVQDITTNYDDRAIISAVTAMAHNMSMKVVAEGVETEDQLSFLRGTRCDKAQGYLFSKSLPAEEYRKFMAANR